MSSQNGPNWYLSKQFPYIPPSPPGAPVAPAAQLEEPMVGGEEPRSELTAETPVPADRGLARDSLSLRHMAASGLTPDGNLDRMAMAAEMANTPGWPGRRIIKALAWLALVLLGLLVLQWVVALMLN